tara:strand:+ start:488 stop:712 length:225 start_codon:yes stop_codon:yes gene_type:complete
LEVNFNGERNLPTTGESKMNIGQWEWIEKIQVENKQLKSTVDALLTELDRVSDVLTTEQKQQLKMEKENANNNN